MDIAEIIFRYHPEFASAMMRDGGVGGDLTRGELRRRFPTLRFRPRRETQAIIEAFRRNPASLRSTLAKSAGFASGATGARLGIRNPLLGRLAAGARALAPKLLGAGTGIDLGVKLGKVVYPRVRSSLPGTSETIRRELMLQSPSTPISTLIEAAQEFNQEQEDLENLIRGPRRSSAREKAAAAELLQSMEEDMQSMRDERRALRAATQLRGGTRAVSSPSELGAVVALGGDDGPESPSVEDVASVLEAMVQDLPKVSSPAIRDREFMVRERPLSSFEKARFQRDRRVSVPYAGKTRYDLDIPDHMRETAIVSQPLPRAVTRDMIKPRRRLQPTSPGTFGELLDESITDFQGAPMMSEREILRMLRGE